MNHEIYRKILDATKYGIYYVDTERKFEFWNKAAEDISGYREEEVIGRYCQHNLLQHTDTHGNPLCNVGCPLFKTLRDGLQRDDDVLLRHKNGTYLPVSVSILPIYGGIGNDKIIGAVESFYPTPTKNTGDGSLNSFLHGLITASRTDTLTGLPNRRTLESYIGYRLENYQRAQTPFSILYVDIDNFRHFNNTYGHDAGDAVLKAIADIFKNSTRENDIFGRWGGEEFIGIFMFKSSEQAQRVVERIREDVEKMEVRYDDQTFHVTISAGLTTVQMDDDMDLIVNRADELMYYSKNNGKNQVTVNHPA